MNPIRTISLLLIIATATFLYSNTLSANSGSIVIYDSTLGRTVPIAGVEIFLCTPQDTLRTFTDNSGSFRFSEQAGIGNYILNWRYRHSRFLISIDGSIPASIRGISSVQPWNLTITNREDHFHATIFRAATAYVISDFARSERLFSDLVINAHFRRKRIGGPGTARYNTLTKEVDIWAFRRSGSHYSDIKLFGFITHELGHAHHDVFFQGRSRHHNVEQRLSESWGEAVKYFLTLEEYGSAPLEIRTFSKQFPVYHGWRNHSWGVGKSRDMYELYTPLMIDLVDTYNQQGVDDRVSGYTMTEIISVLKYANCVDFDSFKRLLKDRYNNPTEPYLDILFRAMEHR